MANITFIHPLDQPTGDFRLLDWLDQNLRCDDYNSFKCLVAFAKIKPFYKLHNSISLWNSKGNCSEAIIGIDHKGTSYQALQYTLANFSEVYILHVDYSTFHPKLYIFEGNNSATAYYGSSNLTSGGLETNFEGGVVFNFKFPEDRSFFDELCVSYTSLLSPTTNCCRQLDHKFLADLKANGLLMDESVPTQRQRTSTSNVTHPITASSLPSDRLFPSFFIKPAKAIPKNIMISAAESAGIVINPNGKNSTHQASQLSTKESLPTPPSVVPLIVDSFVIQVSPHHNGEIFLSKMGIDQNKAFFGYPFTGRTVPKKPGNPTYPQREPDPVVNIWVFDSSGRLVRAESNYNLNTVYYEKKSEIRITITPSILEGLGFVNGSSNYPILVMSKSQISGCDYDMHFYAKGSKMYDDYLAICNQTLPSGGKSVSRKMGWI